MPVRTFVSGESPSAADFNRYFMQWIVIRKTANESVISSLVQQPDDQLLTPVEANTNYFVNMFVIYDGDATADLRSSFTGPAGSTFDYVSDCTISTAASSVDRLSRTHQSFGSLPSSGCQGVGTNVGALFKGLLMVGGTAGTFQYLWSQNTSVAVSTRVLIGSVMMLRKLTA